MGSIRQPVPVKLLMPMLAGAPVWFERAQGALVERVGPLDYVSQVLPFDQTDYYQAEMGAPLLRQFLAFRDLIDPGALSEIKRLTNALEEGWSEDGKRSINLDPGYLAAAKLVLATTKDFAHRVYVGEGIYAEVTLFYRGGAFEPLPWTYPDYRSAAYHAILGEIRALYMGALRANRASGSPTQRSG